MIPLVDLTIDKKLRDKITKEITQVVDSKKYILGAKLESFEKKFAKFIGVKYAIGVGNGTDALRLSLRALGIGRGDKVLTVSLTSPFGIVLEGTKVLVLFTSGVVVSLFSVTETGLVTGFVSSLLLLFNTTTAIITAAVLSTPTITLETRLLSNPLLALPEELEAIRLWILFQTLGFTSASKFPRESLKSCSIFSVFFII